MKVIVKAQARSGQSLNEGSCNRNEEERGNFPEQDFPMLCLQIPCLRFVSHT